MRVRILGSAAGGGFPQWNCRCDNCDGLRTGAIHARARTQSSLAVSPDGKRWALINASPDIRFQIESFEPLHPKEARRHTPIVGVVLVDGQIDHAAGLLFLRENGSHLDVYCTQPVYDDLYHEWGVLRVLESYCGYEHHQIDPFGQEFRIRGLDGLRFKAVPINGNAPPYSRYRDRPLPGHSIGLQILDEATGGTVFYAPDLGKVTPALRRVMGDSDVVLVDGTFWHDDDMWRQGCGIKTAQSMGHLGLQEGFASVLEGLPGRKILVHINNTNPILDENGPQFRELESRGIEVGYDGLGIEV